MRVAILICLGLLGCSESNIEKVKRPDKQISAYVCGWSDQGLKTFPPTEECWLVEPGTLFSIMPESATECDADTGTQNSIWHSGDTYRLFSKVSSKGYQQFKIIPVPCPV